MGGGTGQGEITAKDVDEMRTVIRGEQELYSRATVKWGSSAQRWRLVEELAELLLALCRVHRGRCSKDHLAEEIADARIMIEQIERMYRCADEVNKYRKAKLSRLKRLLDAPF